MNLKNITDLGFLLLLLCYSTESKCTISSNWTKLSQDERLLMSENIVYGKTLEHRAGVKTVDGNAFYTVGAVFAVYCIIKGEVDFKKEITIEAIAPRDGCSGTREHMRIGDEAIVAIKVTGDNTYEYHEVMPTQSATFAASKANLVAISGICDLQHWRAPSDADVNRCPICSIANFTDHVMATAVNKTACSVDGIGLNGLTDCSKITAGSNDTGSVCIPKNYSTTCARLMFSSPEVTCECTVIPPRQNIGILSEVGSGFANIPCFLTILSCLLFVLISF